MEAITLTRQIYNEALQKVNEGLQGESYVSLFKVTFPEGLNTANALEICRVIQAPTMENKIHLMRICIQGKNVEVTCPNGEVEKFYMSNVDDALEAFPLFQKEPLAAIAISDNIYGYVLKKSVRLSNEPKAGAARKE